MMRSFCFQFALAQGLIGSFCSAYQAHAGFSTEGNDILLKLDYATYRGYLNETNEVYTFRNIRFADSPTGAGRWSKSRPPPKVEGIQDRKEAIACTQPPADDVRTVGGDVVGAGSEDCLFLDLTIPRSVFENPKVKVPVLVWVHGGYYTQGSKDERSFHQFAKTSGGKIISVAANYRIGMYGFLGGPTIEKEGIANAGLWDQRAAFEWVQKYIPDIGGDKSQVTTMGISAGAGSLLHHLTAEGGTRDPLFRRTILQSSGYATIQDRADVEKKFKRIEENAGCKGKGLECIKALSEAELRKVSNFANSGNPQGSSGWDPIPDGSLIVHTPTVEISKGRYWKNMDSIISGYALNEAGGRWFVDPSINSDAKFDAYVQSGFKSQVNAKQQLDRVSQLYPAVASPGSPFKNIADRYAAYVADAGFNCHHRAVAQAYPDKTYTYQSSLWNGTHYMDQFPSFFDSQSTSYINQIMLRYAPSLNAVQAFQSYLVSEIVSGNPNKLRNNATIEWPVTSGFDAASVHGVLNFTDSYGPQSFKVIASDKLIKKRCEFWEEVWSQGDGK